MGECQWVDETCGIEGCPAEMLCEVDGMRLCEAHFDEWLARIGDVAAKIRRGEIVLEVHDRKKLSSLPHKRETPGLPKPDSGNAS